MKNIIFLIFPVLLFGCKNEENPITNTAFGMTFNQYNQSIGDSLVSVNFSKKSYSNVAPVSGFEVFGGIYLSTRSINKNMYIYKDFNSSSIIGLIDLSNLRTDYIAFNDTNTISVLALHVDEIDNMIYAITTSYNSQTKNTWLGIVPISLENKKVLPTINFMKATKEYLNSFLSEIDYKNKRIFIKASDNSELIIYNYDKNNLQTKQMNAQLMDLHYNSFRNCLFGTGHSTNSFSLFEYSLTNNEIKSIGNYVGVDAVNIHGFYYDRANNTYWISGYLNGSKLLNINLTDATIKDSFLSKKDIQYIN